MSRYVLPMSPDYVGHWGTWEAIRELLQNSIDQQEIEPRSLRIFDYDSETETLTVGSQNCRLEPRTLLLGSGTKADDPRTIGKFGEGYKLALLVLVRCQHDVQIRTGRQLWRPSFQHDDRYDEHVLVIDVETAEPTDDVEFVVSGVTEDHFATVAQNYIPDMTVDEILHEDHHLGRVYVNGLFVCEVDGLRYGYNFRPNRIVLDRDRGMVSTFEATWQSSQLWASKGTEEEIYDNLQAGIADTQYLADQWLPETTNQYVVERYMDENPNSIPVSSQHEMDRHRGNKMTLVTGSFKRLLTRLHRFRFDHNAATPSERLESFSRDFGHLFDTPAQQEFDDILETSRAWTGPAELNRKENVDGNEAVL